MKNGHHYDCCTSLLPRCVKRPQNGPIQHIPGCQNHHSSSRRGGGLENWHVSNSLVHIFFVVSFFTILMIYLMIMTTNNSTLTRQVHQCVKTVTHSTKKRPKWQFILLFGPWYAHHECHITMATNHYQWQMGAQDMSWAPTYVKEQAGTGEMKARAWDVYVSQAPGLFF